MADQSEGLATAVSASAVQMNDARRSIKKLPFFCFPKFKCDPPPQNESQCATWPFSFFILPESKVFAIYYGENHFQIRGLVAELHVFEHGATIFGTFEKTCFKC